MPPGMRVRTGRFEELRSGETGYSVNPAAPLWAFTRVQALCRFSRARTAVSSPSPAPAGS